MVLALFALVALVSASAVDNSEMCKLSTRINGQALEYDISVLKRSNGPGVPPNLHANWFAIETHDDEASQDNVDDYTYFFNLCGPLLNVPSFLVTKISAFGSDVGVIQRVEDDVTDDDDSANNADVTDGYVLGRRQNSPGLRRLMDGDLRYTFAPAETHLHTSIGWVNTSRHCDYRQTSILLFCADVGLGSPVFAYEGAQCDYVFVWNTCAACPLSDPVRQSCPNQVSVCTNGSAAIKTILLVVLIAFACYLVLGCLFKRFISGARGWDQIPNADAWGSLFGLILDGCACFFGLFRCKSKAASAPTPIKYQGLDGGRDDIDNDADDKLYDIGH